MIQETEPSRRSKGCTALFVKLFLTISIQEHPCFKFCGSQLAPPSCLYQSSRKIINGLKQHFNENRTKLSIRNVHSNCCSSEQQVLFLHSLLYPTSQVVLICSRSHSNLIGLFLDK